MEGGRIKIEFDKRFFINLIINFVAFEFLMSRAYPMNYTDFWSFSGSMMGSLTIVFILTWMFRDKKRTVFRIHSTT